jgi:hypothetical protein
MIPERPTKKQARKLMFSLCSGSPLEGETYLVKDWGSMTLPELWVMTATIKKRTTGFQFDVYRAAIWEEHRDKINITGSLSACPMTVTLVLWSALRNQGSAILLGDVGKVKVP